MTGPRRRLVVGVAVAVALWIALKIEVSENPPHPTTLVGRAMLLDYALSPADVARRLGPPTRTQEEGDGRTVETWEVDDQSVMIEFRNGALAYATGDLDARGRGRPFIIRAPSTRNGPRG